MERRTLLAMALLPALRAGAGSAPDAGQKVMRISTLLEIDPATSVAEQVLAEAYHRLGMVLQVQKYPGERSLVSANDGSTDGELYRKLGMERDYPNLIIVPVALQTYEIVIFTRGTSFIVSGWESLRPFTVGFVRGIKIVEQNTLGMRTEAVPTMQQAFQKMVMGRTDVVVGNRHSGLAAVRALKLDDVRIMAPSLASFPVYHYLHKKHETLVPRLTAVLAQMQKDKVIERIQRAVLGED